MSTNSLPGQPVLPEEARDDYTVLLRRWALVLLLVGFVWRCTRYLLDLPIWGDEAANCMNLIGRDYSSILGQLHCPQVAPLLFWWGELTAYLYLGSSELALRLLPFLAGLAGLLMLWRLACLTLPPLPRTLAVGFLAVATCHVSMSTLIKPYSLDLLASAGLLLLAVYWLRQPERLRWLVALTLLTPLALFASFPCVFVSGSISLALLPAVWRQRGWRARALFAACNLLMVVAFLGNLVIGETQLGPSDTGFREGLREYWAHGFPPASPLAFLKWLFLIHTGRMMAYPLGGSDGLSALTFVLFLLGLWRLWRQRQRAILVLLTGPFVLGFIAAVFRRYPYGGCWRLSQHVAPAVCLLAGLGAAGLIERARSALARRRCLAAVFGLLVLIGLGGTLHTVVRPYRTPTDEWQRGIARQIEALSTPDDQVVVLSNERDTSVALAWYLCRKWDNVGWCGRLDESRLDSATGQVWCLALQVSLTPNFTSEPAGVAPFKERLTRRHPGWSLADHAPYTQTSGSPAWRCDVYRWVKADKSHPVGPLRAMSCRP
jgi:hypothetical protein